MLNCKEIKLINLKGNQSWIFTRRNDAEAETPILWPPDAKNWLTGKDPDAGKDWRQEEKWTTENETVGWHHWLYGHKFEQALEVGDRQGSLACCSPWVEESDTTEWLNWTDYATVFWRNLLHRHNNWNTLVSWAEFGFLEPGRPVFKSPPYPFPFVRSCQLLNQSEPHFSTL